MTPTNKIIYAIFTGDATVAALIGTRCYKNRRPQKGALPAIVYQTISGGRRHQLDAPDRLPMPRVQLTLYAADENALDTLSAAVETVFTNFTRGSYGGYFVQAALLIDDADDQELPEFGDEQGIPMTRLDVRLAFNT